MGLETGTTIAALNAAWPLGTDPRSQGDDHLRLVKAVMTSDALSKAAGGTVAGAVTLQAAVDISSLAPFLRFIETDQTSPAGRYRLIVSGGLFSANRNTAVAGDFSTVATIASFADEGTAAPSTHTIMTREKGDLRYPQLALATLQTITGPLRAASVYVGASPTGGANPTNVSAVTGSPLTLRGGIDTNGMITFGNATGTTIAAFAPAGTAVVGGTTIITVEKGDFRYAPKALLLAALQAVADSAPVAELRDALVAALSATIPDNPPLEA